MQTFNLSNPQHVVALKVAIAKASEGDRELECLIREVKRNNQQNKLMWAWLRAIAAHMPLSVDGELKYLSAEDWKHILTALWMKVNRWVEVDNEVIGLGALTRELSVSHMSEFLEFISAWAGEKGIPLPADQAMYEEV